MAPRSEPARRALVEAAERLFAERGIESVSLRDICAAAGQRNHSAAQYHFADRAGLVAAVFDHRMHDVNDRRHQRLDQLDARATTGQILDATIRPLVEVVAETEGWYARFLVRTRWDEFAQDVLHDVPALSSYRRAIDLLVDQLDGPLTRRHDRIDQMTTLLIGTIAGWEWRRHRGQPVATADELCADLAATCHGVLTAPARTLTTITPDTMEASR